MRILHIAAECVPFSKVGGLGDVAGALPRAQADLGVHPFVVTPRYASIDLQAHALARRLRPLELRMGHAVERAAVYEGTLPNGRVPVFLIDHPVFDRPGVYEGGPGEGPYHDNPWRFALLTRAALALAESYDLRPDLVHAHDWHAGLAPRWLRREDGPRSVFTIHNANYRGDAPKDLVGALDLGWDGFSPDGFEFHDQLCFLKAGVAFADAVTTVSPRYAEEIRTPDFGADLDGFYRAHAGKITGILNGADYAVWDPRVDRHVPARFSPAEPQGKAVCKEALQLQAKIPARARTPVFAIVSRLTAQKGIDVALDAFEAVTHAPGDEPGADAQLVVLGRGDPSLEARLGDLAARRPGRVAWRSSFDEPFAHLLYAGCDFFLMPSRFEPCGLGQLYAFRYGAVPIVRAVGGLDDTVVDYDPVTRTGDGFKFRACTAEALREALGRALDLWRDAAAMAALRAQVQTLEFSWATAARRYLDVYEGVLR